MNQEQMERSAIRRAESVVTIACDVMWLGQNQCAMFVVLMPMGFNGSVRAEWHLFDYDELLLARGMGVDPHVYAVVMPGADDGTCTILK